MDVAIRKPTRNHHCIERKTSVTLQQKRICSLLHSLIQNLYWSLLFQIILRVSVIVYAVLNIYCTRFDINGLRTLPVFDGETKSVFVIIMKQFYEHCSTKRCKKVCGFDSDKEFALSTRSRTSTASSAPSSNIARRRYYGRNHNCLCHTKDCTSHVTNNGPNSHLHRRHKSLVIELEAVLDELPARRRLSMRRWVVPRTELVVAHLHLLSLLGDVGDLARDFLLEDAPLLRLLPLLSTSLPLLLLLRPLLCQRRLHVVHEHSRRRAIPLSISLQMKARRNKDQQPALHYQNTLKCHIPIVPQKITTGLSASITFKIMNMNLNML